MNNISKESINTFRNLTKFIRESTGCSGKQAKKVASQYAGKLEGTTFSCDLTKYSDAIPLERVYKDCFITRSIIGKHNTTERLALIKQFLNNAAAEEAYLKKCK